MSIKKYFFVLAVLALAAGPLLGQVRLTDDREMFIGVTNTSNTVLPNIMVLADNSGSMNTAIYHPGYSQGIDYSHDHDGHALSLNHLTWGDGGIFTHYSGDIYTLSETKTFNICKGVATYSYAWDASATYYSQSKKTPRKWKIYKDTVIGTFPVLGQIITYNGDGSGINDKTRIIGVEEDHDATRPYRQFWIVSVDTGYTGWGNNPDAGSTIYINYHQVINVTDHTAEIKPAGDPCTGYANPINNVKLYGGTEGPTNEATRYDLNYLYWLAFYATQAQINQVTYWATTGKFPNESGVLENAGYFRMAVQRQVLADVVNDVYTTVNMGLAVYEASNAGGRIEEPMSNMASGGTLNAYLGKIANLLATTNTPLAEAMADIWKYYKGGNSYWPNDGTNSSCGSATGGGFPTSCPIQFNCQKNYVIIMTDGQSTYDDFSDAKYANSYFTSNPVIGPTGWGDNDNHDPVNGVQPSTLTKTDGTPYCPENTCWGLNGHGGSYGTDYLDDMAWFMKHNDMFPDSLYPDMPGEQSIETFVIGFTMDNDLLYNTAKNGNGEYYTAKNYSSLRDALKNAIVNILLRNFAFAAFTAPKKVTSTQGEGYSFVGYFLPSVSNGIWEGHLQSFKLTDKWCPDGNTIGVLDGNDCDVHYETELECKNTSGKACLRSIELKSTPEWDASDKIKLSTVDRNLFTHDSADTNPLAMFSFTDAANLSKLQTLFGLPSDPITAQTIINTLKGKIFSDVFHSDIAYVGAPLPGKQFLRNLNPPECGTDPLVPLKKDDGYCFEKLMTDQSARRKVIYVGTNEGILHQVDAASGEELWGFIPDDALPNLKTIVVDKSFTFTVDGRITADDILYRGTGDPYWKTILPFGLRDGGNSFYALDVTSVGSTPVLLWKFKDSDYSGKSWGKPVIGKIKYWDSILSKNIDRWVVVLAGGMAFNNENPNDLQGKAVFVLDASSGDLLWMIGYDGADGAVDDAATTEIDTTASGLKYLTAKAEFNYAIPSALTAIDRDSNGYLDTIYFGNVAGHLFKSDISANTPTNWKTYLLFKHEISTYTLEDTITAVNGGVITVNDATGFAENQNVFGLTSKAMGVIDFISQKNLTITTISPAASFIANETIVVPQFDPIFEAPAAAFDPSFNLWLAFGTGDRIRSRTNPDSGKFAAIRDGTNLVSGASVQKTNILLGDLVPLTWTGDAIASTNIKVTGKWGWYFNFPDSANHEKLFDPEPLILPDRTLLPHVYFNTYQPPVSSSSIDCNAPKEGFMYFYDLTLNYSGNGTFAATRESGRIAGGGMFEGTDFIIYKGTGNVASIPPLQEVLPLKLVYTGGLLFWKERKR